MQTDIIICGDSTRVLNTIPNESVDLILTSPPYNFGMGYDTYSDNKVNQNFFNEFLFPILNECERVLKIGGRLILNVQPLFSEYMPTHHIISDYLRNKLGMIWRNEIIWNKNNFAKLSAWGSWKSPSSPYINDPWEYIEVFSKRDVKHKGDNSKADITAEEFRKYVIGMWSFAPETKMKQFGHPAMFPEELAYRCIKLFSFQDDLVLDPFNGAGTTTLVAHKLHRHYIGIDVSEKYCHIARERIEKYKVENLF